MASSRTVWRIAVGVVVVGACRSERRRDDAPPAPPPRDRAAECGAIFERFHAALVPVLKEIGASEPTHAAKVSGLTTCVDWTDAQRTCLLGAAPDSSAWSACRVPPAFTFYDGGVAHDRLLGGPVAADESKRRLGKLTGTWTHSDGHSTDTWKIAAGGKLVMTYGAKPGAEPPAAHAHELAFTRERLLSIQTGTSTQFVPLFVDGERMYMSWTSGAIAIPISAASAFVLDLADRDRWLVWSEPSCVIVDPHVGARAATCAWKGDTFVHSDELDGKPRELVWARHGDVLVHPAMETYARQGK